MRLLQLHCVVLSKFWEDKMKTRIVYLVLTSVCLLTVVACGDKEPAVEQTRAAPVATQPVTAPAGAETPGDPVAADVVADESLPSAQLAGQIEDIRTEREDAAEERSRLEQEAETIQQAIMSSDKKAADIEQEIDRLERQL